MTHPKKITKKMMYRKIFFALFIIIFKMIFYSNANSQIYVDNNYTNLLKDKFIYDFVFYNDEVWLLTQEGIIRTDGINIYKYHLSSCTSNKLSELTKEGNNNVVINNVFMNGNDLIFYNILKEQFFKLSNDSIVNIKFNYDKTKYYILDNINYENSDLCMTIYNYEEKENLYRVFLNNNKNEYSIPFIDKSIRSFKFILINGVKYFIGVRFDTKSNHYFSFLLVCKSDNTLINYNLEESNSKIDFKWFIDTNKIILLDNLGNIFTITIDNIEKDYIGFNKVDKCFWVTVNNDTLFVSNSEGLFIYDMTHKYLIKSIKYIGSSLIKNIKIKDNKLWGVTGSTYGDNCTVLPQRLVIIDINKE